MGYLNGKVDIDGNAIQLMDLDAFRDHSFEMGFIVHPNGEMDAIDTCDLLLYQHGEDGTISKELCFTFTANDFIYEVKVQYEHDFVHYVGNDIEAKMNERFLTCEVNGVPGRGISEWHYNNVKKVLHDKN
ncbi:hypothetical protein NQ315_000022 [Exocentrus adspersus]|uniref:Uncharacterized protein n=1 Tax=Exocentrus adspersus TaxID=1586481 RepID=A0AAV8VGB8_9CUCU|nr:hypothetical protein NQ315_000022 [Exocentrus adspersus]